MDNELRKEYFETLTKEIAELVDCNTGLLSEKCSRVINCPLCNSEPSSHNRLFIKNGYTFVRCEECEMIFANPQVKEEVLGELYGQSKSNDLWVEIQKSEKEKLWKKDYFLSALKLIQEYCQKPHAKVMDIGCSIGYFLELARKFNNNWDYTGLEINRNACEFAINRNLKVERKFLNQIDPSIKFDIFTMFGVMEHLSAPKHILNDIKDHSSQTGTYVLVIVPNVYSLYHMFIQSKSLSFDGRNHLLYFSEKTLRKVFVDNDFEILYLDTVLTGLDNIKRQIQWFDPYDDTNNTIKYMPSSIQALIDNKAIEKVIYKNNIGLRLRLLAKYSSNY